MWNENKIFSKKWVDSSTYPVSKHGGGGKIGRWYGWLWGVSEYYQDYNMYFASGTGNQFLAIFPKEDLILVNLCNTYQKNKLFDSQLLKLFDLVLAAKVGKPVENPELITLNTKSRIPENLYNKKLDYSKYLGEYVLNDKEVLILEMNGDLVIKDYYMKLKLYPISPK